MSRKLLFEALSNPTALLSSVFTVICASRYFYDEVIFGG